MNRVAMWAGLAAAACVLLLDGRASAQTVIVTNAPPMSMVEVVINGMPVGSTTDAMGRATLSLENAAGQGETEVRLYVDVCSDLRRIVMVRSSLAAPSPGACNRRDAGWLFAMRSVTTFLVDFSASEPIIRVRQGAVPATWLTGTVGTELPSRDWEVPAAALVISGGGGWLSSMSLLDPQCGDAPTCTRKSARPAYTAGATLWLGHFVGVQGTYTRSSALVARGSGTTFNFDTSVRAHILNFAGNVGMPFGPTRLYGIVGTTYTRSTTNTSETIKDLTLTVNGAPQVVRGGTQQFSVKTTGWGLLYGGGFEWWLGPRFGLFAEGVRPGLQGKSTTGGEARLDAPVLTITTGLRFNLIH